MTNSHALTYQFSPSVLVKSTYTDNEKQSVKPTSADIITELAPGFSVQVKGTRTQGNLNYSLRKQSSYTQNIDNTFHTLNGTGNFAAVKNYVNTFATGRLSQRQNQVGRNILFDQTLLLSDTATVGSATAGIELTNYIKRYFDSKLRYTYNTSQSNSTTFADTESHNIVASLKNGTHFWRLTWGGDANYRELTTSTANTSTQRLTKIAEVTANMGYKFNRLSGFTLMAGYESNPQYLRVNPNANSKGVIATATAFWRSPKKVGLEFMAGTRAFGNTYQAKADWQTNNTNASVSYGKTAIGTKRAINLQQKLKQLTFRLNYNETLTDYNFITFLTDPTVTAVSLNNNQANQPSPFIPLIPSLQTGTYIIRKASSGILLKGVKNSIDLGADYSTKEYTETGRTSRTYKAKAEWKNKINTLANTIFTTEAIDTNDPALRTVGLYTSVKFSYEHRIKKYFLASLSAQRWGKKSVGSEIILVHLVNFSIKATY